MNLAIIPARGGSKRIPRKNIRNFCGKPMIVHSIEAARESGCFQHIVISTDDAEIAHIAVEHGAEVPFTRPAELSDDHTGTRPVIQHAIKEAERNFGPFDYVCSIYATAPFLRASDLQKGLTQIRSQKADFAVSVASFPYPIQRALRFTGEGHIRMFHPENAQVRSQKLEEAYHDAGQFYWGRTTAFMDGSSIFADPHAVALPIVLPRFRVQDIDTEEDWRRAELMFRALSD